jgi:hypothetical protein
MRFSTGAAATGAGAGAGGGVIPLPCQIAATASQKATVPR